MLTGSEPRFDGAGRENRTPLSAAWKAGVSPRAYPLKKQFHSTSLQTGFEPARGIYSHRLAKRAYVYRFHHYEVPGS